LISLTGSRASAREAPRAAGGRDAVEADRLDAIPQGDQHLVDARDNGIRTDRQDVGREVLALDRIDAYPFEFQRCIPVEPL
jgi:hypothetical protein